MGWRGSEFAQPNEKRSLMRQMLVQTLFVLNKDLLLEWSGRSRLFAVWTFAVTVLLLFSFAAGANTDKLSIHAAGYLWLAVLLASVLALSESFRVEIEDDALASLQLLPVDPRSLFLGKAIANTLLLLVLGIFLVPITLVLFDARVGGSWVDLVAILLLGSAGLSAPGTLYAAMTTQARGRDVMLPLLLFPLVVPVILAAVKGSTLALTGDPMNQTRDWILLLLGFDVVYWALCPIFMGLVVED